MKTACVYILASKCNGTLYIGVTSNLVQRIYQHKTKLAAGFTQKYNVDKLVYFEVAGDLAAAVAREKQLKKRNRQWKLALSADYRFDKTLKLTTKFQHTDNASSVDQYIYDKSILKIGLSKLF